MFGVALLERRVRVDLGHVRLGDVAHVPLGPLLYVSAHWLSRLGVLLRHPPSLLHSPPSLGRFHGPRHVPPSGGCVCTGRVVNHHLWLLRHELPVFGQAGRVPPVPPQCRACKDPFPKVVCGPCVPLLPWFPMLDDRMKQLIFDRFKMCKIIMCGDHGYQLDGFAQGDGFAPFTETGFDNVVEHTNNYRVTCEVLRKHLAAVRLLIKNNPKRVRQYIIDNFQNADDIENYKVEDMILTRTHVLKDKYTEKYQHLEKYYVINTDRNYCLKADTPGVLKLPGLTRCVARPVNKS